MSPPAPHLVDEIHEEIFLRLPDPAALARASTACPRFRSIITDRSFLRRYRKRHPPPLLGFADEDGFHPAEAPHPSAPLARALADAADFTYSFVPRPNKEAWRPCDIRDGRVLLEGSPHWKVPRNLAVCDPLSRRYMLLPPIPGDPAIQEKHPIQIDPVLLPIGEDEDIGRDEDETSFKVICFADYETKLVAFVFSSTTQKWCIAGARWANDPKVVDKCESRDAAVSPVLTMCVAASTRHRLGWTSCSCRTHEKWCSPPSAIAPATMRCSDGFLARWKALSSTATCLTDVGLSSSGVCQELLLVEKECLRCFLLLVIALQMAHLISITPAASKMTVNLPRIGSWRTLHRCLASMTISQWAQMKDSYSLEPLQKVS